MEHTVTLGVVHGDATIDVAITSTSLDARSLVNAAAVTADTAVRATTVEDFDKVTLRTADGTVVAEHDVPATALLHDSLGVLPEGACGSWSHSERFRCERKPGHLGQGKRHRRGDVSWGTTPNGPQ